MPDNKDERKTVIPVDRIRETIMPPYDYQRSQNGYGSVSAGHSPDSSRISRKSDAD
ncbi:MAG: hypothetical protein OXC66_07270 [Roseovarius sp.]|nr:hypothetical protein [Roseovarius sp.]